MYVSSKIYIDKNLNHVSGLKLVNSIPGNSKSELLKAIKTLWEHILKSLSHP